MRSSAKRKITESSHDSPSFAILYHTRRPVARQRCRPVRPLTSSRVCIYLRLCPGPPSLRVRGYHLDSHLGGLRASHHCQTAHLGASPGRVPGRARGLRANRRYRQGIQAPRRRDAGQQPPGDCRHGRRRRASPSPSSGCSTTPAATPSWSSTPRRAKPSRFRPRSPRARIVPMRPSSPRKTSSTRISTATSPSSIPSSAPSPSRKKQPPRWP